MDAVIYILLGLAIGTVLGGAIGWLAGLRRASVAPLDPRMETDLRQRIAQQEGSLSQLRDHVAQANIAAATAEAGKAAAEKLLAEQCQLHDHALKEAHHAQEKAIAGLREEFRLLSADALKQTHPEFLRMANETLGKFQESAKGDLEKRQESIKTLIEPLKQQLETYQKRLQQSETAQAATLGEVRKQLETLSHSNQSLAQETQQFRMVLRSNQARGRWGEETLRRVVEVAGMSTHCDFSEQTQTGDSKPDLIVRLPGNRVIIVDAKVPDLDFLDAADAAEPGRRAEALSAHAGKLKATIKALADRDYPSQFPNALDYVVLFLPAESLFSAALEGDHELMIWAQGKRIILATPSSLIAILRSVSVSWQQHSQTENARAIADTAQELFSRVAKFTEHFERIRSGLEKANDAFNDAVGSYERMVRPQGEKLLKPGGGVSGKDLADVHPLDGALRPPSSP
jgi:DNA recombination protein RmuC